MQDEVTQGPATGATVTLLAELPDEIKQALDQSADDLRHGSVEDAAAFLERLDVRIEAYLAAKQARAAEVEG